MSVDKPSKQHSYNQKKSGPTTQSKASTMKEHHLEQSQTPRVIENEDKSVSNSRKVRRAFSMPRNPFRWSRKFKTTNKDEAAEINITNQQQQQPIVGGGNEGKHGLEAPSTASRVLRRSSFRKFLTRIAQHVSSVSFGAKHSSSPNGPDRVPPLGGYQWPADQTPGVTGLKNHGNTCFMNAVLQCLSHTDILAEYFVLDQYKADLKRRNKLNSRKFGTKGELTEQLANVLKALWTCKNETDHSTSFKAVVDRYGSQFRSSTQHDAQEFLFWLLDKVHEDLNTATKRRYKTIKNNYGRPDEIIAAETLANHIRCNNSFVQAVFQAQFRSSLTCNRCHKQSNTFDPFHCISVQLPQLSQQTIFVTVLYVTQHPRQVKLGLTVPPGSPIVALREQLHADTGIAVNRMVLVDINETGFCRVFCDSQPISTLDGIHSLYCIEIPDIKQTESSSELLLLIANVKKDENAVTRFGTPFCMQVNRDCTYVELQKKILKELSAVLKPEVFAYTTPTTEMFQIRLQDPSADPDTYLEQVEHPLLTEMIDMALSVLSTDAGPAHVKLLLEWSDSDRFFSDLSDPIVEHESVSQLKDNSANQTVLTLEQCLEHYTKAETLSAEDAWRCPNCQQYLPVVKTLGLWSLPDILVIHFKRFRQQHDKGPEAAKLTTMVKFPLNAFDMSPHLARGSTSSDSLDRDDVSRPLTGNSPWRKTRDHHKGKDKEMKDNRYDLYAVCYHQGDTLETGHYTAACKNPYDHLWYKFDDQRVNQVPAEDIPEQIVNNEAYILFYQRRKVDTTECSGTSSTSGDHWVSRIAIPSAPLGGSCCSSSAFVGNGGNEKQVEHEDPNATANAKEINSDTTKPGEENKLKDRVPHDAVFIEKTDETEVIDVENIEFADDENKLSANKVQAQVEIVATPSKLIEKPSALDEKKLEEIEMVELTKAGKSVAAAESDDGDVILSASTTKKSKETEAEKNKELRSNSSSSNEFSPKPLWPTTKLRSSYNENIQQQRSGLNFPEAFSNSIRSTSTMAAASLGHSGDTSLRHSFSTSSSYKLKDCDALSMIRNAGSSCSKDTLLYIDQQNHSLIDDDDSFLGGRSLWISPVTPHKLITVSPKN